VIVNEIEDDQFVNEALVRENMLQRYKGAKKDHTLPSSDFCEENSGYW